MTGDLITTQNSQLASPDIMKKIQERHIRVSNLETPKNEVKKDPNDNDYVEVSYMRRVADKEYPGWSWHIIDWRTHPVTNNEGFTFEVGFSVHGRLTWIEDGLIRQGDMTAGHANYLKKSGKGFVSVSNAWKSANTECMKKAFNMYMNIADDVYRNIDTMLEKREQKILLDIVNEIGGEWLEDECGTTHEEMHDKIVSGVINKNNYNLSKQKLEKWLKDFKASK